MNYTPELREKLSRVKMIITDVDGVLTDGAIYKGAEGMEYKRFSVEDGAGMAVARAANLRVAWISGRYSDATESRAKELKIEDVYNGVLNKLIPYEELLEKYNVSDDEVAYIGDGLIDLVLLERVGVPISVENAYSMVKESAIYVTEAQGGWGAFREAVDWILKGQGTFTSTLSNLRNDLLKSPSQ